MDFTPSAPQCKKVLSNKTHMWRFLLGYILLSTLSVQFSPKTWSSDDNTQNSQYRGVALFLHNTVVFPVDENRSDMGKKLENKACTENKAEMSKACTYT